MSQRNKPSRAEPSARPFTMPPLPTDQRTPEQKLRDKLELQEMDRKMTAAFKDGVDLSGQETP